MNKKTRKAKEISHAYEPYALPKGTTTEKILDILSGGVQATSALFQIASEEVVNFSMRSHYHRPIQYSSVDFAADYRESKSFYALLYKLRNDGFIKSLGKRKAFQWHITPSGLKKLLLFRKDRQAKQWQSHLPQEDGKIRIVTYDIPEREFKKRNLLRTFLELADYALLQRSVWIGKRPLPEEFLQMLRREHIFQWVHIIEVGKSGTLKQTS